MKKSFIKGIVVPLAMIALLLFRAPFQPRSRQGTRS